MAAKIPFIKTYSTPHELVQLLKTRGMEITDEEKAQHYLSHIGYYRLSAYMYPLLSIPKEQHLFKQGVTFGKVMMLYRFDKKLRLLLFNEIEKIEVAVRCAIVNFGTEMTGNPFWMTDANNFSNPSKFNRSIRLIEDEQPYKRGFHQPFQRDIYQSVSTFMDADRDIAIWCNHQYLF